MLNKLNRIYQRIWSARELKKLGIRGGYRFDPSLTDFLVKFQPAFKGEDLVVYDIGAAVGSYAALMAQLPQVRCVHAFEPTPQSFARLAALAQRDVRIRAWNVAAGEVNGGVVMNLNDEPDCSSLLRMLDRHRTEFPFSGAEKDLPVRLVRLDDFVGENRIPLPDVLKIDVQGYELKVLAGAPRCLSHARAVIAEVSFVPLYENSPLFEDVLCAMKSSGFRLAGVQSHGITATGGYVMADVLFENPNPQPLSG
jgi:FkbM family methyltransferase